MIRLAPRARAAATFVVAVMLVCGGLAQQVSAQTTPDRSHVVLVVDFSASILEDKANRNRFGAALERIADRVEETSADLVGGDATVTIVQFATLAADQPGCADMKLLGSPETVVRFANCLRAVAGAYRKGLDRALTKRIGVDTNYVAALEQAAKHLPADAVRPALILFTDGKHDVRGVPLSRVQPTFERLFGTRSPLAVLPVGMGLDPGARGALENGLQSLRVVRDMPPCVSGASFDWPTVVFESPDDAGNSVAVALQDATCTFTVEPTPVPTEAPKPGIVQAVRLTPGDSQLEVTWAAPASPPLPIVDYKIRCRAGDGDWVENQEGVSLERTATIGGLSNGTTYECQVAAVTAASEGDWSPGTTATPVGRPVPPGKPSVQALDHAVLIGVAPAASTDVSGFRYDCSGDNGETWIDPVEVDPDSPTVPIGNLTNGVGYICRAFAVNATGLSDASPLSDLVKPCGSAFECNPLLAPIVAVLGSVLVCGLLLVVLAFLRDRTRGYVVAVVDVVHTANLGHGSRLGLGFQKSGPRTVTGIVPDRSRKADIRIRHLRGDRFAVTDRKSRQVTTSGESIVVTDSAGVRHALVLWAFATQTAADATSRR